MDAWVFLLALGCLYLGIRLFALKRALRRLRRAEPLAARSGGPSAAELSLAAMIEELEAKEQAILKNLAEREAALMALLGHAGARIEAGAPSGQPPQRSPRGGAKDGHPAPQPDESRTKGHPAREAVQALAKSGCAVEEIARRLQLGKGEVELILNLWR